MEIVKITGEIELITGLHIGGGDDTMKIGGIDNQVIKDINSGEPYIPGSSLKGKMRSLLEWSIGLVGVSNGEPATSDILKDPIFEDSEKKKKAETLLKLFGDKSGESGITRISVGDCYITDEIRKKVENKELKLSEAKYENVIDRRNGTAKHPRQTERVPAGVKFDFDIRIKVLDGDDKDELISMVKDGLRLIEEDYLGGNGSRGYGRVKFHFKD